MIRWKILKSGLVIALASILICLIPKARGQTELHCPDFLYEPQRVASLPGQIVYQDSSPSTSNIQFDIWDGENMEQRDFNIELEYNEFLYYLSMSPDTLWVFGVTGTLASDSGTDNEPTEINQIWMYELNHPENQTLLLESPPRRSYLTSKVQWINQSIYIPWGESSFENSGSVIIHPFVDPVEYVLPQQQIADWQVIDFAPTGRHLLLWQANEIAIYDIRTGILHPIVIEGSEHTSVILTPQWSSSGRLVFAAVTESSETEEGNYEEFFVVNVNEDTYLPYQVSNFAEQFGVVSLERAMVWSPNEQYVAFKMARFDAPSDVRAESIESSQFPLGNAAPGAALYLLKVETAEVIPLCVEPEDSAPEHFFWSPDSQYLAFNYDNNLVVVDVETQTFSIVTEDIVSVFDWK